MIHSASLEVLGLPFRKHQDWFDDNNTEVQQLIEKMHSSHKAWIDDKNSTNKKTAYKACKNQVQRALRAIKEAWWSAKAAELPEASDKRDSKTFYDGLKKVFGPQEGGVVPMSSADGKTLLTETSDILERWKQHFETVLSTTSATDENVISSIAQRPELPQSALEPTLQEVLKCIKQILSGKAPGKDAIPPKVYKSGGHKLIKKLHALFIEIWRTGCVPQDLKDASIKHLYKNKCVIIIEESHFSPSLAK